ncbi:hypothetical protein V6N11_031389 [Hibiscus sabdariffa]|uniref:CCHC-type domain-containing protein n=1 Tax=Hibiscus sabdariffa TaxID=183260 RepID=A0ABR2SXI4_9ROSI
MMRKLGCKLGREAWPFKGGRINPGDEDFLYEEDIDLNDRDVTRTETRHRGKFARMTVRINLNKPFVSKIVVNGKIQLIEYESLPIVCFNCDKYGHMNDNCPDLQHNPTTKVPLHPSEHTPTTLTTMFGLWMVVEKRKRRPQTKEAVGKCTTNGVSVTESRFTPIFYSNTDDPASPKFARPSTTSQSAAHKRIFKTKSTPPKQASASLKSKGKTSTVAQHTAAFNVLTSRLDGNKHSSISLPENSDPNIPNDDFSLMANNVIGEPPRKPPDLIHFASPKMGQAQKALPEGMQHDARSADVLVMINDAQGSAMTE